MEQLSLKANAYSIIKGQPIIHSSTKSNFLESKFHSELFFLFVSTRGRTRSPPKVEQNKTLQESIGPQSLCKHKTSPQKVLIAFAQNKISYKTLSFYNAKEAVAPNNLEYLRCISPHNRHKKFQITTSLCMPLCQNPNLINNKS